MSADDALRELGRGIARLHLKLAGIQERLAAAPTPPREAEFDALFDLIEAVESAIERLAPRRGRFWRRDPDGALWRGLAVAAAEAREHLQRAGIEQAPLEGRFDPLLHRAIEVVPASPTRAEGTLAATHRRGWLRRQGSERVVLRTAQVSVHGAAR
jgi:molecular chaperone GrpE (heat shock protein)